MNSRISLKFGRLSIWRRLPVCWGGDILLEGWKAGVFNIGHSDNRNLYWIKMAFIAFYWEV